MWRNSRVGGGGGGRTRPRPPQLGMPVRGGAPPDLNGARRGGGYGGMYKGTDWSGGLQHGGQKPGGMPQPQGFDYDAFNAWVVPTIGGQQPGPIQAGWGGFSSISGRGNPTADPMLAHKMNNYLNQQATGGARETMMNQLGYFNGGNAFTPRGRVNPSQSWMDQSMENLGPDSQYQVMSPGGRGYAGIVTGGQGQTSTWNSLAPGTAGRTRRRTRTFGQVM